LIRGWVPIFGPPEIKCVGDKSSGLNNAVAGRPEAISLVGNLRGLWVSFLTRNALKSFFQVGLEEAQLFDFWASLKSAVIRLVTKGVSTFGPV
jgi:hypothetical protein